MKPVPVNGSFRSFSVFLLVIVFIGCSGGGPIVDPFTMTTEELTRIIKSGEKYLLVDVRDASEFDGTSSGGHIPTAINIPVSTIMEDTETEVLGYFPDKGGLIIVYCKAGGRSTNAFNTLVNLGYTNVRNFGGVSRWTGRLLEGSSPGTSADL